MVVEGTINPIMGSLPGMTTAGVIVPFSTLFLVIIIFSFLYLSRYRKPHEPDTAVFLMSCFSFILVLLSSSLIPIDIFIASSMKTPDGHFADWASENATRVGVEHSVKVAYYLFYSSIFLVMFIAIPFTYFFYEEQAEDVFADSFGRRVLSALKYTVGFLLIASILLVLGATLPLRQESDVPQNSTEWDKMKDLIHNMELTKGEDALAMVTSIMSLLGFLNLILYTGFGMFSWPIGLIRGLRSARTESEEIQEQHLITRTQIEQIRERERMGQALTERDRTKLRKLEDTERKTGQRGVRLDSMTGSIWYKCRKVMRPMEIVFGSILLVLAILIWISLLLSNIDKLMHGMGPRWGYTLEKTTIVNPLDATLILMQKAYPLDYILFISMTWFLIMCSFSGIRNIGVRFLFLQLFKLKPKGTQPQGLLLTAVTMMLTVFSFNILLNDVCPQYTTFGNQKYIDDNGTLTSCDTSHQEKCQMTTNVNLLTQYFFKAWFFGATYFWCTWVFLMFSLFSLVYVVVRHSRSVTDDVDDEDLEGDDDPNVHRERRIN